MEALYKRKITSDSVELIKKLINVQLEVLNKINNDEKSEKAVLEPRDGFVWLAYFAKKKIWYKCAYNTCRY